MFYTCLWTQSCNSCKVQILLYKYFFCKLNVPSCSFQSFVGRKYEIDSVGFIGQARIQATAMKLIVVFFYNVDYFNISFIEIYHFSAKIKQKSLRSMMHMLSYV